MNNVSNKFDNITPIFWILRTSNETELVTHNKNISDRIAVSNNNILKSFTSMLINQDHYINGHVLMLKLYLPNVNMLNNAEELFLNEDFKKQCRIQVRQELIEEDYWNNISQEEFINKIFLMFQKGGCYGTNVDFDTTFNSMKVLLEHTIEGSLLDKTGEDNIQLYTADGDVIPEDRFKAYYTQMDFAGEFDEYVPNYYSNLSPCGNESVLLFDMEMKTVFFFGITDTS